MGEGGGVGGCLLTSTCNPDKSLILWKSLKKTKKKKTRDRISTFQYVWGKPDFTPEQFLNQAALEL